MGNQEQRNAEYKEFNRSCSDYNRLRELDIPVLDPHEFVNYGPDDFDKLDEKDKQWFYDEEDRG